MINYLQLNQSSVYRLAVYKIYLKASKPKTLHQHPERQFDALI